MSCSYHLYRRPITSITINKLSGPEGFQLCDLSISMNENQVGHVSILYSSLDDLLHALTDLDRNVALTYMGYGGKVILNWNECLSDNNQIISEHGDITTVRDLKLQVEKLNDTVRS